MGNIGYTHVLNRGGKGVISPADNLQKMMFIWGLYRLYKIPAKLMIIVAQQIDI